jgi:hypothetical protein
LYNFLPKILSQSSQKYGFGIRDPGSEIRDLEKTYSGSRILGSRRNRIPDPRIRIRNNDRKKGSKEDDLPRMAKSWLTTRKNLKRGFEETTGLKPIFRG